MKISDLFENNRLWATAECEKDPEFFHQLAQQQSPKYLWIGCSDSRVPANEIVGLRPGDIFVHRNVSNLVIHSDLNCLAVIQFAVDVLKVRHIIVCGHYGCGGIQAAMSNERHGLVDNWLLHVRDLYRRNQSRIDQLEHEHERLDLLCEVNVVAQAVNVGSTTIVQDAWNRGQELTVHALIYSISDGLLKDLESSMSSQREHRELAIRAD
jgi:carbonic anhydrase